MKKSTLLLYFFVSLSIGGCKSTKTADSVKKANMINEQNSQVNNDVADFLVKIADARMMGRKEGELAVQKGTTPAIVNYGKLMIKDQDFLLAEIKKLAISRGIKLPTEISESKQDGFQSLSAKNEKDFDDKFIKMMRIDHERDIKDFKKATEFDDKRVVGFVSKYLPLLESHLAKLNDLKN